MEAYPLLAGAVQSFWMQLLVKVGLKDRTTFHSARAHSDLIFSCSKCNYNVNTAISVAWMTVHTTGNRHHKTFIMSGVQIVLILKWKNNITIIPK